MILAYYGKWLPIDVVRRDCGVSRDGSNAKNILLAARAYGMEAKGYRYEPDELKSNGSFPCIIHWNFNHFVVLCDFKGKYAVINDPANGAYLVSQSEFDKAFTGVCIKLKPGEDFKHEGKQKHILSYIKKRVKGAGKSILLIAGTSAVISAIEMIVPGFARFFADNLLDGKNSSLLLPFIIALSFITAIQLIASWINTVYSLKINGKAAVVSDSKFMWHVLRLPMDFLYQRTAADIAQRKLYNTEATKTLISELAPLVIQGFMLVFYLTVLLRCSVILTLVGILAVMINLSSADAISKKRINIMRGAARDMGHLLGATVTGIEIIDSIKASGAEAGFFEYWAGCQAAVNKSEIRYTHINAYMGIIPTFVTALTEAIVFAGGIRLCTLGEWTVGMTAAFSVLLIAHLSTGIVGKTILRILKT